MPTNSDIQSRLTRQTSQHLALGQLPTMRRRQRPLNLLLRRHRLGRLPAHLHPIQHRDIRLHHLIRRLHHRRQRPHDRHRNQHRARQRLFPPERARARQLHPNARSERRILSVLGAGGDFDRGADNHQHHADDHGFCSHDPDDDVAGTETLHQRSRSHLVGPLDFVRLPVLQCHPADHTQSSY